MIEVRVEYGTSFGESLFMVGSTPTLGEWDPTKSKAMEWSEGNVWKTALPLKEVDKEFDFKVIIKDD